MTDKRLAQIKHRIASSGRAAWQRLQSAGQWEAATWIVIGSAAALLLLGAGLLFASWEALPGLRRRLAPPPAAPAQQAASLKPAPRPTPSPSAPQATPTPAPQMTPIGVMRIWRPNATPSPTPTPEANAEIAAREAMPEDAAATQPNYDQAMSPDERRRADLDSAGAPGRERERPRSLGGLLGAGVRMGGKIVSGVQRQSKRGLEKLEGATIGRWRKRKAAQARPDEE